MRKKGNYFKELLPSKNVKNDSKILINWEPVDNSLTLKINFSSGKKKEN